MHLPKVNSGRLQAQQASQRVVRRDFVVPLKPFGSDVADLMQGVEQVGPKHFLAVCAVTALEIGVLVGLARFATHADIRTDGRFCCLCLRPFK
jgi:hypothetical protein